MACHSAKFKIGQTVLLHCKAFVIQKVFQNHLSEWYYNLDGIGGAVCETELSLYIPIKVPRFQFGDLVKVDNKTEIYDVTGIHLYAKQGTNYELSGYYLVEEHRITKYEKPKFNIGEFVRYEDKNWRIVNIISGNYHLLHCWSGLQTQTICQSLFSKIEKPNYVPEREMPIVLKASSSSYWIHYNGAKFFITDVVYNSLGDDLYEIQGHCSSLVINKTKLSSIMSQRDTLKGEKCS